MDIAWDIGETFVVNNFLFYNLKREQTKNPNSVDDVIHLDFIHKLTGAATGEGVGRGDGRGEGVAEAALRDTFVTSSVGTALTQELFTY